MMEFDISYTSKEITPWGGMVFLKQMLQKIGFTEIVKNNPDLPQSGSNRGYKTTTIIEGFITSIWCGANRFLHTEVTRHDRALGKIFNWSTAPGQDTYKRFFGKFNQATNQKVSDYFYSWIFDNFKFDNFTLDIDSSVMTRYGQQEGAKKGYNPAKKGRPSHHPIIAFIDDVKLVANMWLRSGNTSSANNFLAFLDDTLSKLKNKTVSLIRLDSGFFQTDILDYLELKSMDYIIAAKFTHPIQKVIHASNNWIVLDTGIEICEQIYQSDSWNKPRRMVIVRQKIKDRPQAPGKQLSLFCDEEIYKNYRYSAYVTNLKYAPAEIWRLYRGRANAENRIKELKYDFGFDSFNLKDFFATEAALTFAMIAYNLMALFRTFILQEKTQRTLSTLRYRTFAIGAYFEKVNDKLVLKIALNKKRREWFSGLWNYSKVFDYPFVISNA
ncbi:transposase [Candidatus Chloroploca asiatica]|uniref:Transposase n=2 Tax=Candidatus Chloroploca asiatica TaxID=1506545 RepID=A0A2H3LE55_9CHLR|nr:transposase [Candidatus Chloroploca asiatica]